MIDLNVTLEKIIKVVKDASNLFLDDFTIEEKGTITNIVTTNDINVQHYLISHLKEVLPEAGFLCEEEDYFDHTSYEYVFVIDPIDGTENYSRGIQNCAISVGLTYKRETIIGVVYSRYSNELFTATKGGGAFMNGKPIHVSNRKFNESLLSTAWSAYDKSKTLMINECLMDLIFRVKDFRRFGSAACEISYVAMGRTDMFFEHKLSIWDFTAASLILTEAGGVIRGFDGPLDFSTKSMIMVANNEENLSELSETVHKYIKTFE